MIAGNFVPGMSLTTRWVPEGIIGKPLSSPVTMMRTRSDRSAVQRDVRLSGDLSLDMSLSTVFQLCDKTRVSEEGDAGRGMWFIGDRETWGSFWAVNSRWGVTLLSLTSPKNHFPPSASILVIFFIFIFFISPSTSPLHDPSWKLQILSERYGPDLELFPRLFIILAIEGFQLTLQLHTHHKLLWIGLSAKYMWCKNVNEPCVG